jgi:hypothetical protein
MATQPSSMSIFNLGCLHPVACVRSGDGGFYLSTQTSLSNVNFITYRYNLNDTVKQRIRYQLNNPYGII